MGRKVNAVRAVGGMRNGLKIKAEGLQVWLKSHALELGENRFFVSVVVHAVVVFFVLNAWWFGAKRMKPPGTAKGVEMMMTMAVGKPKLEKPVQRRHVAPKRLSALKSLSAMAAEPEEVEASSAEAKGDGPATILFVQGFPAQRPAISAVSLGSDLVVDVMVDENGRVIQTHKEKGMSASVDAVILATVQQWIFHPAKKDGKAIPSVQELHFHFDARLNPGCGWECIQLQAD